MYRKVTFIYSFIFIFIIVSLTHCKSDDNGNSDTNNSSNIDEEIIEYTDFKTQTYKIPEKSLYIKEKSEFLYDYFYPIGWSVDGKFAYIYEPADEATGFYFFVFEIKDFNTGKIVWKYEIGPEDEIEEGSLKKTWDTNTEKFVSVLNENKIIQNKKFEILQFPIIKDKKTYNLKEDIKYSKGDAGFAIDYVSSVELYLNNNEKKYKIYNEILSGDFALNIYSAGYYKSPFNNMSAIVLITEMRGYEGPPNVLRINPIACNLDDISE